jgi:hypothetical protein
MGSGKSKPEKEKKVEKAKLLPAVLDPDEVINCFDEVDDNDVGFKFIYEKDVELVKDIRMTNGFFEDNIEKIIYGKVNFPETNKSINQIFDSAFSNKDNLDTMINFFKNKQNITFKNNDDLLTFTLTEVKNPLLSKNKHEFAKLIMKQVKNFVMTVKLVKKLNYTTCRDYLIANFEQQGIRNLLEAFATEIKKHNSVNQYWIEVKEKADDHIREAYQTFEHNVNTALKLILLYYERANLDYQVLSKIENKINYNILVNNFLYWSITNIEKSNFPVFKLYLSELGRLNYQINQKIGKQQLIELIVKYRGESHQFFQELKNIKEDVQNNILNAQTNSGTLLFKPIKEKFNNNFRKLVDETLPLIYNKFPKFKTVIEKALKDHFDDFFKNMNPPFHIKTMVKLNKGMTEKAVPEYILSIMRTILFLQADVYHKKFNLDYKKYERRTDSIMDLLSMQLNESLKEEVNFLRDMIIPKEVEEGQEGTNFKEVRDKLQPEYDKFMESYNTTKISLEFHVYIMFSVFICFSGLELRREGGKLVFKQGEYSSASRHLLFKLTNRMRNYDFAINNWTLINYMEYNVEDFLEEYTLSKSSKIQNFNQSDALYNLRYGRVEKVVEYLREELGRLKAYLRFSMDQEKIADFRVDKVLDDLLSSKEYFFSFKPLFQREVGTNSRHILIFVSSFLNQAENQEELWKDFIKGDPYTECYAFNWPTMDLFSYNEIKIQMEQEYRDNNVKADIFHLGVNLLNNENIQALKLDKLNMSPPYGNLHYMAMLCGKALAFFIGQLKMFETSAVSLVGFSMGSVVTYYCLKDIYYMRKSNMIYNYISIGSPMSKDELEPEIVKLNMGAFFNVYSMDDKVLKYIASLVPYYKNPCGLMELTYDDALYASKKIKVYNYDMTSLVHCHMDFTKYFGKVIDFVKKSDDYKYINSLLLT